MRRNTWRHCALISGLFIGFIGTLTTYAAGQTTLVGGETAAPDGTTPLHQAVRRNDVAAVDALIKRGADVNASTRYGITPMNLAATRGNAAMIRRLLDA